MRKGALKAPGGPQRAGGAGTPGGTRTPDRRIRNPMLYPLSYRRTVALSGHLRENRPPDFSRVCGAEITSLRLGSAHTIGPHSAGAPVPLSSKPRNVDVNALGSQRGSSTVSPRRIADEAGRNQGRHAQIARTGRVVLCSNCLYLLSWLTGPEQPPRFPTAAARPRRKRRQSLPPRDP